MKPYRLVYFGTSEFAADILNGLSRDKDFEIALVVTQPDRPVGRKQALNAPPVKRAAELLGLPIAQPESLKDESFLKQLRDLAPLALVTAAYGKILPKALLDVPVMGSVNVHGSLLPKFRGAAPISAAIASGDPETGNTIMLMNEKMDEGPVLATGKVDIHENDTVETLRGRLAASGAELLGPTLKLYFEHQIEPVPQEHAQATYTKILDRADGKIDWTKPVEEIERFVRAMTPWPAAWTVWKRQDHALKIILKKTSVLSPDSRCDADGRTGGVCRLADGTLGVNCGNGSLRIDRLQIEGKGETDGKSFLNGYKDFSGATLE